MKMEAECSFETLVNFFEAIQGHITEDSILKIYFRFSFFSEALITLITYVLLLYEYYAERQYY
jgi:hypothetical protein